eukprot:10082657-Alexandrium_andersonii.AAC.1
MAGYLWSEGECSLVLWEVPGALRTRTAPSPVACSRCEGAHSTLQPAVQGGALRGAQNAAVAGCLPLG